MKLFKLFRKKRKADEMIKQFGLAFYLEMKDNPKFVSYINNSVPKLKKRTENIFKKFK